MTTAQLAKRLSIAQPSAVGLEKGEASRAITLETLERAARALDCTLVYSLVPRKPLEQIVQERARDRARDRLRTISMTLEDQRVREEDEQAQLERLVQQLLAGPGSALWDER